MRQPNDAQRARLYRAESEALRAVRDAGLLVTIEDDAIQAWVDHVIAEGHVAVTLLDDPTAEHAKYIPHTDPPELWLPDWARNDVIILHELAHHATPDVFPWHGAEFMENYLHLLTLHAPQAVESLREAFVQHKLVMDVEARRKQTRRVAVNLVNRAPRCLVTVVCNDPPSSYVGQLVEVTKERVVLSDVELDWTRVHYVNVVDITEEVG